MLRKALLVLWVAGSVAGCEHKDVAPGEVSDSAAARLFERSGETEVKLTAATLGAIEKGLSATPMVTKISYPASAARPELPDQGCQAGNADVCLALILDNARNPPPQQWRRWIDRLAAMPVRAGGDAGEVARLRSKGEEASAEWQHGTAAKYYAQALELAPTDLELATKVLRERVIDGSARDAVAPLEKVVLAQPLVVGAWSLLANVKAVNGDTANAANALLVAYRLAEDQKEVGAQLQALAAREDSRLRPAAAEALAVLDGKTPADTYEALCRPALPAVLKTCEGATISGVARYQSGGGTAPVSLTDGHSTYLISAAAQLAAREGQLVRFTAVVGPEAGTFTQGRLEPLPFVGNASDKQAWDALQLASDCAAANSEYFLGVFYPAERLQAIQRVRLDAAHPGNGAVELATRRAVDGYAYRCAFKDGKLAALQARETSGEQLAWVSMAEHGKRRAAAAERAAQLAAAERKAQAEEELKDPRFIRAGRLLVAANRGVGQAMRYDHAAFAVNQGYIEDLQKQLNATMENGSTEQKIRQVVRFAKEVDFICATANAPCTELRDQLGQF
jgi:hypothetical protein